jgi:hypothetical protein
MESKIRDLQNVYETKHNEYETQLKIFQSKKDELIQIKNKFLEDKKI